MTRFAWLVLALPLALMVSSCRASDALPGSSAVLESEARLELFSLSPVRVVAEDDHGFHGWTVLGSRELLDSKLREAVVSALASGIRGHDDRTAACFRPRHGLRATTGTTGTAGTTTTKTVDMVICFECFRTDVHVDSTLERSIGTKSSPQTLLDRVLREAGVELATPP